MIEAIERLLTLQDRDLKILGLRQELRRIPEDRKIRERQLADCLAKLEASKANLRDIEAKKKSLEVEAAAKRNAIERYKTQQLQTRKNEEYSALANEIAAAEREISSIEDRELELMEEAEALAPAIREAEAVFAEEKSRIGKALAALDGKTPNIEALIKDLEMARAEAAQGLDNDLLEQYERIFRSKGGAAVVPLDGEACSGCHMNVTNQIAIAVRGEKSIVHCPSCGRILHLPY